MTKIIISLILISTQVLFSQPASTVVAGENELKFTKNDSIRYLNIPDRPENAIAGSEFVNQVSGLSLTDRERAVAREILTGNVPSFSRKLRPLTINQNINTTNYELTFFTVCDYMAIGSDQDYLYIPMTPSTAQYLADRLDCTLPTKKMVDIIYNNAEIKLNPQPIPPSDKMTTVPVFKQHTDSIKQQIAQIGFDRSADNIIAGHKKDIIISNKIYSTDRNYDRVVIYGWHTSVNHPIQPVYNGHYALYADYSHGVRLISNIVFVNGDSIQIDDILKDPTLSRLLSSEGVINKPYYPESDIFSFIGSRFKNSQIDFKLNQNYPNPFNPTTIISYSIPERSYVTITIYDVLGKKVTELFNGTKQAGVHEVEFVADNNLSSGVYFYEIKTPKYRAVNKMMLLR